jgi:hypothetical protein
MTSRPRLIINSTRTRDAEIAAIVNSIFADRPAEAEIATRKLYTDPGLAGAIITMDRRFRWVWRIGLILFVTTLAVSIAVFWGTSQ